MHPLAGLPTLRLTSELRARAWLASSFLTSRTVDLAAAVAAAAIEALPAGFKIDSFEVEAVIARGASTFVYLARDLTRDIPVAIKEFAPARNVGAAVAVAVSADVDGSGSGSRAPGGNNLPKGSLVQRGLDAFISEARVLAACNHPSLVRIDTLLEAHGTAYRVMPLYQGVSLARVRSERGRVSDAAAVRAWSADLTGALQALHKAGHAHGSVSPENVLLLADNRLLLLGAGSRSHRVGSDWVETLLASFGWGGASGSSSASDSSSAAEPKPVAIPGAAPTEALTEAMADDLRALAAVMRFCVEGEPSVGASATPRRGSLSGDTPGARKPSPEPPLPARLMADLAKFGGAGAAADLPSAPRQLQAQRRQQRDVGLAAAPVFVQVQPLLASRPSSVERWKILLLVGLIVLSGAAVLAAMGQVMGAWQRIPPMDFDSSLQTAPASTSSSVASSAPAPVAATPPRRSRAEPERILSPPLAAPSPLPAAPSLSPAPSLSTSDALSQTTAPLTQARDAVAAESRVGSNGVAADAAEKANEKAAEKTTDRAPEKTTDRAPEKTPEKVTEKMIEKAERSSPAKAPVRAAKQVAAVKVSSPAIDCSPRTNFALERCLQTQCQTKKWAAHPQCISRNAG